MESPDDSEEEFTLVVNSSHQCVERLGSSSKPMQQLARLGY